MSITPRTPVIVGVGQVTVRPDGASYASRPHPLDLMVTALERAAQDSGSTRRVLESLDEIVAVGSFTWHTRDPGLLIAQRLGLRDVTTKLTGVGGNAPQKLVHDAARRILTGEVTTLCVVGAEAMYARLLAKREGRAVDWTIQSDEVDSAAFEPDEPAPLSAAEFAQGLSFPTIAYPIFENARRARLGWSIEEQRGHLGRLWSNFASVAATNPYAWMSNAPSPETVATPGSSNRMVAFPYTKLLMSNLPVDMGAALIITSYEHARSLGVGRDRMVFPQFGVEANDHWLISERPHLDDSPAMRAIWRELQYFGVERDELGYLDLYSCFPTVVQSACDALGIDAFDPSRIPTLTGGLTFAGGPGNNYVTHSIASMVDALRADPTSLGLVTALGYFCTKHAWGTYAASPPTQGFRWASAQAGVDALARVVAEQRDGAVTVESYTVTHGRSGAPERLICVARTIDQVRVWCHSTDERLMVEAETSELIGQRAMVSDGELFL